MFSFFGVTASRFLPPAACSQILLCVKRIYEELNIYCQPVALNSGSVWPKNGKLKPNKTLTVSILDPIDPGMNSVEFINMLQKNIYEEIDKIV